MGRFAIAVVLLVAACGKDNSPRGLCERGCKKMLGCANASDQQDVCVAQCVQGAPDQAAIEKLEGMSCDAIGAGANAAAPGAPAPAAAPARAGCNADCRGCVGDNSSCYAAAGGANGIPCDPCCCAPGGGAPTWKTDE